MTIALACGHDVKLDAYYSKHTYAGLLKGRPLPEFNAMILADTSENSTAPAQTAGVIKGRVHAPADLPHPARVFGVERYTRSP